MLIISFDAIGDSEFGRLSEYPAFNSLLKQSALFRGISTVFLSNTYPVHTSAVTGVTPGVHGIISNTEPFPSPHPLWNTRESSIRVKTVWQAAAEKGIQVAAVLWPLTAYSKTIRYNIPESLAPYGKNQVIHNLKAGSTFLQLKMFLRHRALINGVSQPGLDSFSTACMVDILREYNPGLALIHLTAYDMLCHKNGKDSAAVKTAFESLDRNLAALLDAAGDGRDIILFSDHGQINVHTVLDPNAMLVARGLLTLKGENYIPGESGCYIECCGGSAFFHSGKLLARLIDALRADIGQSDGFRRFLSPEEMLESGRKDVAFGFSAKSGYSYEAFSPGKKADHGYPLDIPDYTVFYMVRGSGMKPGGVTRGGSLLDIAPLAARSLKLEGFGTMKG